MKRYKPATDWTSFVALLLGAADTCLDILDENRILGRRKQFSDDSGQTWSDENRVESVVFRVGAKLSTTIYRGQEAQPCAWVPGDSDLAKRIVSLLNQC